MLRLLEVFNCPSVKIRRSDVKSATRTIKGWAVEITPMIQCDRTTIAMVLHLEIDFFPCYTVVRPPLRLGLRALKTVPLLRDCDRLPWNKQSRISDRKKTKRGGFDVSCLHWYRNDLDELHSSQENGKAGERCMKKKILNGEGIRGTSSRMFSSPTHSIPNLSH